MPSCEVVVDGVVVVVVPSYVDGVVPSCKVVVDGVLPSCKVVVDGVVPSCNVVVDGVVVVDVVEDFVDVVDVVKSDSCLCKWGLYNYSQNQL